MCNRLLVDDEFTGAGVSIGQLAHIVGWSTAAGSPRGSEPLPVDERNDEGNLMLLCYDQHRVIDSRSLWQVYDADTLREMKRRHEQRIRQLTALRDDEKTTMLRLIGGIRGASVAATPQGIAAALLANQRFPDYALLGVDELEVDLRPLADEETSSPEYWVAARAMIEDRLRLLRAKVSSEKIRHISVFPFARIPLLVVLGALLDDTLPTDVYPKRRDAGEGWGWPPKADIADFEFRTVRRGTDPLRVSVLFSISGSIDLDRLPAAVDETVTVYEVRPIGRTPSPDVIARPESSDNFARAWRDLLAHLEHAHPGLTAVNVFPAVPVTAAVSIGRAPMRGVHPTLRIHDRTGSGGYEYALEVTP